MISKVNNWAQQIIIVAIISTIIEMILPKGNNKKYIKTIMGIYTVFVIIHPIITEITGKDINLNEIMSAYTYNENKLESTNSVIDTNSYVEGVYKENIINDIKKKIEQKGYIVNNLDVEIEMENEEKYGEILSIYLEISKNNENKNTVSTIEEIKISVGDNKEIKETTITEEEKECLQEYLKEIYYAENININCN